MYKIEFAGKTFFGQHTDTNHWWLADGLTGWYDSLKNRVKVDDVPGQHGGFKPQQVLTSARHMVFECAVDWGTAAVAEGEGASWAGKLAALGGIDFTVTDESGTLMTQVWVDGDQVLSKRLSPSTWQYSIPLVAPDPLKYGALETVLKGATYVVSGGLQYPLTYGMEYGNVAAAALSGYIQLSNSGTADVYPTWRVRGPITVGFQITSDAYTVTFNRALLVGEEVVMGVAAGGRAILKDESGGITDVSVNLTSAQWAPVPPASNGVPGQRGFLFSPLGVASGGSFVEATIRDGWF